MTYFQCFTDWSLSRGCLGFALWLLVCAALVGLVVGAPIWLWLTWSHQQGSARAYLRPLEVIGHHSETVPYMSTTFVQSGNVMVPITTTTYSTSHFVDTPEGSWRLDMKTYPPLGPLCARIEPRPGQGHFITAVGAAPCPEAP